MPANMITFTANHLSLSFQPSMKSILPQFLYVGLGLEKIPPTVIHLNYNGNTVHVFESYLNQISKMSMYFNHIWINIGSVFVLKICI